MRRSPWRSAVSAGCRAAVALLLCVGPAGAGPLAQVRIRSLQAVYADAATLAAAAGRPERGEDLLGALLGPFGLRDLSVLDGTRPLAAVLPLEGMLLQQRGVVVALPVAAAGPLLDALGGNFPSRGRDGGLEVFSDAGGPVLYAQERDGYVVAGQTRQFVAAFDLAALRAPLDGPPGSVVAELDLEPLAPLLLAGLVGAREQLRQQVLLSLSQPRQGPPGDPPVDPEALAGMLDLYLDAAQSVLMDLGRVQLGVEIRGEHLFWHNRVVVRPNTATAEFVAHQGGGLPPLSRVVPPGSISMAGQVKMTPRAEAALAGLLDRYFALAGALLAGLEQGAEPAVAAQGGGASAPPLAELGDLVTQGLGCFTGEAAASLGFSALEGISVAEAVGTVDTPRCRDLSRRSLALLRRFSPAPGGAAPVIAGGQETIHGIAAERFAVDLGAAGAELPAEEQRLLRLLYGGPTLTSYVAATGPVTYYALGGTARGRLQAMLDAAGDPGRTGIDAGTFAPLLPGPGFFVGADVPKLLAAGLDLLPEDDPGRARWEHVAQVFAGAGAAGRAAAGLRFDPLGATLQIAVPLRALEASRPAQPLPAREAAPKQ
ncbi:MAG: hypothetical protein P1P84_07240 [Deferrisomatales bacterium]|nr:hypothetical protein [Deferrisomatales bacterium]